jgi:predicted NUDIX family phosphoesterase
METILCMKRTDLPVQWLGETAKVPMDETIFRMHCARIPFYWIKRSVAEMMPSYKQLIPYVILRTETGNLTACYRRKGSESRLHGLWSCGIGGHVNPVDAKECQENLNEILNRGLSRELDEELPKRPSHCRPVFRGIINEEKTEVGTVHMGLVYTLDLADPSHLVPGGELIDFTWNLKEAIQSLKIELWSLLALELIGIVDKNK